MSFPGVASNRPAQVAVLLAFAVPALLPFGRWAEVPIALGAVIGLLGLLLDGRALWAQAAVRALLVAFGMYTLAALISSVDAVAPGKSWSTTVASLRFGLFGVGLLALLLRARDGGVAASTLARALGLAAALPIAFWVADALVQAATGYSLGGTLDADRLSGIFGADDLKLGPILPTLVPLLLWPLCTGPRLRLALAYLAVLVVVMLAGARAGWVSLIVVSVMLGWRIARGSWARMAGLTAAAVLVTALIGGSAYHQSETFKARVDRTLLLKKGTIDVALAGRIWIWQTANAMAQAHPINGVGVRGFRYAYPNFSYPIDPWINPQTHTGAAHAHQIFLELLTETGVIGLSLWFIAAATLWALARRSGRNRYTRAPWVALMVMMFPINTHLAFYSSFMGVVIAWLIALACAQSLLMPAARQTGPGNAA